ncbi:hypothetical protein H6G97_37550 [Nostoc flagelliforme FACHB-838]|uniref:Uncharacterized protein n=1 Tax=Nostoc flagelliforme FACHB-838 TaxID=2692904 RepID=A0ABR8DZS1_9NOSO|nr:hypothetical protein [Nostoc flagelliforme]MBD2534846.1 hypothetical protein [Nostoc flagelliforme FACHB-838]
MVIDSCQSYDELDFIFPEISRFRNHDFAILEIWQAQVDWMRSLLKSEIELLVNSDFSASEPVHTFYINQATVLTVPPEQLAYKFIFILAILLPSICHWSLVLFWYHVVF